MKKYFLLVVLILYGCVQATVEQTLPAVRLATKNGALKLAAIRTLKAEGIVIVVDDEKAVPLLTLREVVDEKVNAIAADGSIGSYEVSYHLRYHLNHGEARHITRSEVLNHNENRYRASQQQRQQMIRSIRLSALREAVQNLMVK